SPKLHSFPTRRSSDLWMQIMGLLPGSSGYAETRRLMETSMPGDTAGFHPRFVSGGGTAAVTASGAGLSPSEEAASSAKREIEFRSEEHTSELQSPDQL